MQDIRKDLSRRTVFDQSYLWLVESHSCLFRRNNLPTLSLKLLHMIQETAVVHSRVADMMIHIYAGFLSVRSSDIAVHAGSCRDGSGNWAHA
jgi:hypothetical protein